MPTSLFRFSEVEAKTAKPLSVNTSIRSVLKANGDSCWIDMERYLMPPGISGSRAFDQAYAVNILLKHDKDNGGMIHAAMEASPQLTHRVLWDRLQSVLRVAGFRVSHGRLIGLLENPKEDDETNGQPDID